MPTRSPAPAALRAVAALLSFSGAASAVAALAQEPAPAPERPAVAPPPAAQSGAGGAPPSNDAFRMGSPPELPAGTTEEEIWPAATAEGWAKPVLVHWQRSFDDALRVARAENRPLLIAVNMDGEIASEHFAGVRYREEETAVWMSQYACVIASVYRHTPRDYDETGRRVVCPRFGTVTCGEHVEAERELYDTYFEGKRVSPRHIVLDLEAKETLDVYYSWDTETVFTTFRTGLEGWPEPNDPEKTLLDLVKSADVADREAVERAYREGDRETKRLLLETLVKERVVDQVELLRESIFGFDLELARLGRRALAECRTEGALDLMAEALKSPLEQSDRELLLAAVKRLGETSPRARTLAALHGGLSIGSERIDPLALQREYEASAARAADPSALAQSAEARPTDPQALLALAEALLARAHEPANARFEELLVEDARAAVADAQARGASGPRVDAILAVAAATLGQRDEARRLAVAAIEGGWLGASASDAGALDPKSTTRVLMLFADARQRAIRAAFRAGEAWPPEWLADLNAAYSSLPADALRDPTPLLDYYDFLRWIGATPRSNAVLDDALRRFPDSPVLHERLRERLLWEGGADALEAEYAARLARADSAEPSARTQVDWFAGYASLLAAEHRRRRGDLDGALADYERAMARFQLSAASFPDGSDNCLHYVALARAGRARIALEQGALERATDELLASFATRAESAASLDGLGLTPVMTAKMLQARLSEAADEARAAQVQAALDALAPHLHEPPPFEPRDPRRGGGGRGGAPRGQAGD